jgi:hypothetical protein
MSIQQVLSKNFPAPIWRMEIDELSETLFLEVRDNADKNVSFASVSLQTGETLFKDITSPERWLTGIEAAYDSVLLLHFYQNETGPVHKGLMALDGKTGEQLWANYALALDYLSVDGPIVFGLQFQPRKYFLLDVKTGATTRVYPPSVLKEMKSAVRMPEIKENNELTQNLTFKHPFGNSVHYLEHNSYRVISLHALKGGQLIQLLYVFEGERVIYEDIVNSDIQKMQPEAFILHKNRLIYLKNRLELKILSL